MQNKAPEATPGGAPKQPPSGSTTVDDAGNEYYLLYKWPALSSSTTDSKSQATVTNGLKYLLKEQVLQKFRSGLNTLLNSRFLPYNPYPLFIRMLDQQVTMDEKSFTHADEAAKSALNRIVKTTNIDYVCSDPSGSVWGLSTIVRSVDAGFLQSQFAPILEDMTPRVDNDIDLQRLKSDAKLGLQVFVSLIGESVFYKTFYERYNLIQIRAEYLITGQSLVAAIDLFVRVVLRDLSYHHRLSQHVLVGAQVSEPLATPELQQKATETGRTYQFWTVNEINSTPEAFITLLTDSVNQNGSYIYGQFLTRRPNSDTYVRVEKQYGLHFMVASDSLEEQDVLLSFVTAPFSTLYEGIFFQREMAETYCGMVSSRYELVDGDKPPLVPLIQSQMAQPARRAITKWEDRRAGLLRQGAEDKPGEKMPPEGSGPLQNAAVRLKLTEGERVRVDGFRILQERELAPDMPTFVQLLQSEWRLRCLRTAFINVYNVPSAGGLFALLEMMPLLISYVLSDREKYAVRYRSLLTEMMFMLRCDAARMYELIINNLYIRELARMFTEKESRATQIIYARYKRALRQFFDQKVHQRPAQFNGIAQLVSFELGRLHQSSERDITKIDKLPLSIRSVLILKRINNYMSVLLIELITIALSKCPTFLSFLAELGLSDLAAGLVAATAATPAAAATAPNAKQTAEKIVHGYEDPRISDQDKFVVDVEQSSQEQQGQSMTADPRDAVYLKYVADTRIDDVWQNYLLKIFTEVNTSVISPYTLLLNELWQASMKMHLFYESLETFEQKYLLERVPRLIDASNQLYSAPSCNAYGYATAIQLVDPLVINYVKPFIEYEVNDVYADRRGEFRTASILTLSGTTLLYGKLDPFLDAVRVSEHIYIKGPLGAHRTAVAGFAEIIREHVLKWCVDNQHPVVGVMLGTDISFKNDPHRVQRSALWTLMDLQTKFVSFEAEVQRVLVDKEPIYFISFVPLGWRYVPLIKRFHLHYVNFENNLFMTWTPSYILSMHFDVMMERERAVFHLQQGGVSQLGLELGNAARIKESCEELDKLIWLAIRERFDWCEAYRYLMLKAVLLKNNRLLHDTWKFLHSIAAELDYINSVNKSLQMLVLLNVAKRGASAQTDETVDVVNAQVNAELGETMQLPATNSINEDVVAGMFKEFLSKSKELLNKQVTIIPDTLLQYVISRLDSITEKIAVPKTGSRKATEVQSVIRISTESIVILEDVYEMVSAIKQQLVYNINDVLEESKAQIAVILREMDTRYELQRRRPDDIQLEHNEPTKMSGVDPHAVMQLSAFRISDDPKIIDMENMRSYIMTKPNLVMCDHLNEWWLHQF